MYLFLSFLKINHVPIYHLEYKESGTYTFFCLHRYHKIIQSQQFSLKRLGSTGFLFFLLSFFRHQYRIVGWGLAICLFYYLTQLSWGIEIQGSREKVSANLYQTLSDYGLGPGEKIMNQNQLERIQKQIGLDYINEIDWLNLYLDGHVYKVSYTPKVYSQKEQVSYTVLVASDDAMIDYIDVSKGQVLVKKNQHVKKGDVLVTNEIVATNDEVKLIETKGKIFGYTYKTYEASMKSSDLAENFATLHLKLLEEVQKEIGEDGHIDQENVLHYEAKGGTISLKVQFTLYKNIAQKEIFNEQ